MEDESQRSLLEYWEQFVEELSTSRYRGLTLDDYYNDVARRSRLERSVPSSLSDHFRKRLAAADEAFRSVTWTAPHTRLDGDFWFEFRVPIHPFDDMADDLRDEFGYEFPAMEDSRTRAEYASPRAPHLCPKMAWALEALDVPFEYDDRFREYAIIARGGRTIDTLHHCPWCGAELPPSLRDEWFQRLRQLHLEPEDPWLPDPMRSGDWWRREGL